MRRAITRRDFLNGLRLHRCGHRPGPPCGRRVAAAHGRARHRSAAV